MRTLLKWKKSSKIGFVLVILFMIIRYSVFGLIADFAIIFNIILLISLLSLIEATLTMPGIAGIVLTIGMVEVDANVLVFERIKEELRHQAGQQSIQLILGYKFAVKTILDANFTTPHRCATTSITMAQAQSRVILR